MTLKEINNEIMRVKEATARSKNDKLKRDYEKYLRKLERKKASYERYI